MNKLVPVEFKNQRVITTELLAEIYGTTTDNIKVNFNNHKDNFKNGKHYFYLEGDDLKEFKSQVNNIYPPIVNKFTSSLYLWTARGANRHCKILDTDKAWEQFDNLEETYFRVKEVVPKLDNLSPQLQLLINMELKQKQLESSIKETKEEVQAIREVVEIKPSESWRGETNRIVTKICFKLKDYSRPKEEIYSALEQRAGCNLRTRLNNLRGRAYDNCWSQSKINNLNYLDVISEDKKLIEIYTTIVKEMAIKYKVA